MAPIPGSTKVAQLWQGALKQVGLDRAVQQQVSVTGGAMNTGAQSSVQTQRDKAMQERRDFLLGQPHNKLEVAALEAPHLGDNEGPTHHPRRYRRKRQDGQPDKRPSQQPSNDDQGNNNGER